MKIVQLIEPKSRELPHLQQRVLAYLEEHPDEVFGYRDGDLAARLAVKQSALGFSLWALERQGLIEKEKVGRRFYFGSHGAVAQLRRGRATSSEAPFLQARENARRVYARVGRINTLDILDSVRAGN